MSFELTEDTLSSKDHGGGAPASEIPALLPNLNCEVRRFSDIGSCLPGSRHE